MGRNGKGGGGVEGCEGAGEECGIEDGVVGGW